MAKQVNQVAFLNYLEKCYAEKQTIAQTVEQTIKPALLSIGITSEDKIKAYIDTIVYDKAQDVNARINFLNQFVEEVPQTEQTLQGE